MSGPSLGSCGRVAELSNFKGGFSLRRRPQTYRSLGPRLHLLRVALRAVVVTAGMASCSPVTAANEEAIDGAKTFLQHFETAPFSMSAAGSATDRTGGALSPNATENVSLQIRRDGEQFLISLRKETLRDGMSPWRLQHDFVGYSDASIAGLQVPFDDDWSQVVDSRPLISYWSKEVAGVQDVETTTAFNKLDHYGCAVWWIGRTPLAQYMAPDAKIHVSSVGDNDAIITAESSFGVIALEVSRAHGWLPKKYKVTKFPESLCAKGTIQEWFSPPADSANAVYPAGDIPVDEIAVPVVKSVTWEGTASDFLADDRGNWSPRKIVVTQTINYRGGSPRIIESSINIENLDFNPSFEEDDFRRDLTIPVNSRVTVRGAEHLPFKWDGAKPVPGLPDRPPSTKREIAPLAGASNRALLIGVNIAIVIVLTSMLAWRRYSHS